MAGAYAIIPAKLIVEGGKFMTSVPETAGGYVVLTGYTEAEDDGFNAYCPELGVATCGDTVEEVLDGLQDALAVYLEDWDDPDDLARMLRENGVEIKTGLPPRDLVKAAVPIGKTVRVYVQPVPVPAVAPV